MEGKCRTLVFFDISKPPFRPQMILDHIFEDCQSPLIVAFASGKAPGFVRERISKDGGLGKLVESCGVEWTSCALHYPSSWPKLLICYRGTVDNWDLFKDAKRLEVS